MNIQIQPFSNQPIVFNFEAIKTELTAKLDMYTNLVVTEDAIKSAKTDRADLNKLKAEVEAMRKRVKTQFMEPYDVFEKQVKEITGIIDKPILAIDGQVKSYEEMAKEAKRAELVRVYDDHIGPHKPFLPLTRIWNERWLNVTFKQEEAETEIKTAIERFATNIDTIKSMKSQYEDAMLTAYINTLDLAKAIGEHKRLEEQKANMLRIEEEKARREAYQHSSFVAEAYRAPSAPVDPVQTELPPVQSFIPVIEVTKEIAPLEFIMYQVVGNKSVQDNVVRFLESNGYKYETWPCAGLETEETVESW